MSAMEPINTHEFPLSHESIEEWQTIPAASAGEAGTVGSVGQDRSAASAVELVTTGFAELGTIGGADFGLWEMSAGSMRDIEGHEVFLVISGTGRVEFDEPLRDPIELVPGSLVRLDAGMKPAGTSMGRRCGSCTSRPARGEGCRRSSVRVRFAGRPRFFAIARSSVTDNMASGTDNADNPWSGALS